MLSNRTLFFLREVCTSGQKCSRNKSWTGDHIITVCGIPKALSMSFTYEHQAQMWDCSHKCLVFQHTVKQTAINNLHRIERETVTGCSFVAQQCTPSYCCPYNDHPSNAELEHSQQPTLQFRLDDFRFLSGWTHQGSCKRLKNQRS